MKKNHNSRVIFYQQILSNFKKNINDIKEIFSFSFYTQPSIYGDKCLLTLLSSYDRPIDFVRKL